VVDERYELVLVGLVGPISDALADARGAVGLALVYPGNDEIFEALVACDVEFRLPLQLLSVAVVVVVVFGVLVLLPLLDCVLDRHFYFWSLVNSLQCVAVQPHCSSPTHTFDHFE